MLKRKKYSAILFLLILFSPLSVLAQIGVDIPGEGISNPAPNPSAAYCEGLGYEFIIKDTPEGQTGICKFSDSEEASAWDFLSGKDAEEHSYCSQEGYEMKVVDDPEKCGVAYSVGYGCLLCVLKDGTELEASNFLKTEKEAVLEDSRTKNNIICNNDNICSGEENKQNCPQDCVKTDARTREVPQKVKIIFLIIIFSIILIMFLAYYFLIRKKTRINNNLPKANNNLKLKTNNLEEKDNDFPKNGIS